MTITEKVLARLRVKEAEHRRTNRLPYADEYREEIDLIEALSDQRAVASKDEELGRALNAPKCNYAIIQISTLESAARLLNIHGCNAAASTLRSYMLPSQRDRAATMPHAYPAAPQPAAENNTSGAAPQAVKWATEVAYGEVRFNIGHQYFTLRYDPSGDPENVRSEQLEWMRSMLEKALGKLAPPQEVLPSQLIRDGVPTFYISVENPQIPLTHRLCDSDIPVWCKDGADGLEAMRRIQARPASAVPLELLAAITKFRQAFVIAVGDASPFSKMALKGVDDALATTQQISAEKKQ